MHLKWWLYSKSGPSAGPFGDLSDTTKLAASRMCHVGKSNGSWGHRPSWHLLAVRWVPRSEVMWCIISCQPISHSGSSQTMGLARALWTGKAWPYWAHKSISLMTNYCPAPTPGGQVSDTVNLPPSGWLVTKGMVSCWALTVDFWGSDQTLLSSVFLLHS